MALLPSVDEYMHHHTEELNAVPVWLYSVGIGPALRGPIGRRIATHVPKKIATLRDMICPVGYAAFAGHYERVGVSLPARILYRLMGGGRFGDLRDWDAIIGWTTSIAHTLRLPQPLSTPTHP